MDASNRKASPVGSSAAQPALDVITSAEMLRDIDSGRLVGYCDFYRLAFYNIGWGSITRYMDGLATEICEMVRAKCVDAVGIGGHQSHYPCDMLYPGENSNFAFQCYMVEISSPTSKNTKSGNCSFR